MKMKWKRWFRLLRGKFVKPLQALKECSHLGDLLRVILSLGNYINGGTPRGQVTYEAYWNIHVNSIIFLTQAKFFISWKQSSLLKFSQIFHAFNRFMSYREFSTELKAWILFSYLVYFNFLKIGGFEFDLNSIGAENNGYTLGGWLSNWDSSELERYKNPK